MSETKSSGEPASVRTPEQHDAVRRRALPVAIAGLICGVIGAGLPWTVHISAFQPPSVLAMNLAFCAMLMGAGILFYVKGTSGTGISALLSAAAIGLGMAGIAIFTWQGVQSRSLREQRELENV